MQPTFFATPAAWRKWLQNNHGKAAELLVGFYRKETGRPSITWPESVDEALCFGWIDGVRRRIDDESYSIRFTPRRPGSIWSTVNTRRAKELIAEKKMRPPGLAAFEKRKDAKTSIYAYEQRGTAKLTPAMDRQFKANKVAWAYWSRQPPGYRHLLSWYVISAKKEETRAKRLARLIGESAKQRRVL